MKKLLVLLFSIIFSSTGFADWIFSSEDISQTKFYFDTERIRKHDGYVYFWALSDLLKPDKDGDLSYTAYFQGDCGVFRKKKLSLTYYKGPMGTGRNQPGNFDSTWEYPKPGTVSEINLQNVCDYVD